LFQIKHNQEPKKVGRRKKSKANKTSLNPITLIEGDLNDIGDTVRDATTKLLQRFKQQQKKALGAIRMGLRELQIQESQVQTSVGQSSVASTNLVHGKIKVAEMVRPLDP